MLKLPYLRKVIFMSMLCVCLSVLCGLNICYADGIEAKDLNGIAHYVGVFLKVGATITLVVSLGVFTYNIIKLGASSTNVNMREQAIRGLILSATSACILPITYLIYELLMTFVY